MSNQNNQLIIATDGSCFNNPGGPTGWAWVTADGRSQVGGQPAGTNQIAELQAVLCALQSFPTEDILIQIDSEYAMKVATVWAKGWAKRGWVTASGEPVKNIGLVKGIYHLMNTRNAQVTFQKVPAHDSSGRYPLNDMADKLAKGAAQRALKYGAFQD